MQQPEEILKYDKNTNLDYQKWIQVRNSKQNEEKNLYCFHGEIIIEFLEAISNRSYF